MAQNDTRPGAPTMKPWIAGIHAYVPGKSTGADGRKLVKLSRQYGSNIPEDMQIAMLQESVARAGRISFDELITRLESQAQVKVIHAPGGGDWNKVQSARGAHPPAQPKVKQPPGASPKHWRDQTKELRREKAKAAGLKPWDEGYPE